MRIFVLLLLVAQAATSQNTATPVLTVDRDTAASNLLTRVDPVYPPIAKAAHVQGSVQLQIDIDKTGHVTAAKAVNGPPMLIGAATECVKKWVYKPFENAGEPTPATAVVTVDFTLGIPADANDEKTGREFFPLFMACAKAAGGMVSTDEQATTCKKAADAADQFSSDARFIERRSAFVYASGAFLRNKQLPDALVYANKAVVVVEQGQDDGSGSSSAYSIRAQVEAESGDLPAADRDLTKAEAFERSAIEKMGKMNGQFTQRAYIPVLKDMLGYHAQVLAALGNADAAKAKSDEASKL